MTFRGLHSRIPFRIPDRILVFVLLTLCGPGISYAQDAHNPESTMQFFEQRAYTDAAYEQQMEWKSEEDEMDYWTDQRNFESTLQKNHHQAYQVYINSKRIAYIEHRDGCTSLSRHGDYYQLQSAFYLQYGGPEYSNDVYIATTTAH